MQHYMQHGSNQTLILASTLVLSILKANLNYLGEKSAERAIVSICLTNSSRVPKAMQNDWQCFTQAGFSPS